MFMGVADLRSHMFGPPATDTAADDRATVSGGLALLAVLAVALLAMSHPWAVAAATATLGVVALSYRSRGRLADAAATATTDQAQRGPEQSGVSESD